MDRGLNHELLSATSELISHCKQKGLKVSPDLFREMKKGPSWLRVIAKLHFSGMDIIGLTPTDLGLDGMGETCDEHRIYIDIINKLMTFNDIRNKDSYEEFMGWLVNLNFLEDYSNESVIDNVPGWQKSMQPELCHLASDNDRHCREGFDPNWHKQELEIYKKRHTFMKQLILEAFIAEAPREFVVDLFKNWLLDKEICEWLFKQHYYPLNMLMDEYCEWNLLLYGLPKILPEIKGDICTAFRECDGAVSNKSGNTQESRKRLNSESCDAVLPPRKVAKNEHSTISANSAECDGFTEKEECFPEKTTDLSTESTTAFGRTLITRAKENCYLKVQSKNETDREFRRGYERLCLLHKLKHDIGLVSFVPLPKRLVHVHNPDHLIETSGALLQDKEVFKSKARNNSCLAMEFTTPVDIPYEEYVYDVEEVASMEALHKYANDYGCLWMHGTLPPPCLSAFHDVNNGRQHGMLAPFLNLKCEGSIEQWNGLATDFPNIGGPKIGMRDKVDILLPEEKSSHYFSRQIIDTASLEDQNKIRLEELAKAAQGLCLQYARCFNHRFSHNSQESIKTIEKDISGLLVHLFSNALPLSEDECRAHMEDHNLLNQCCREISYWLAKDTPYVSDLRKAEINRKVYPHLPLSMQGCVLTAIQSGCLKEHGFVDVSKSYNDSSCQLGAQSGRMPLIALNALVVKLLAYGALRNAEMEQLAMAKDSKTFCLQSVVA